MSGSEEPSGVLLLALIIHPAYNTYLSLYLLAVKYFRFNHVSQVFSVPSVTIADLQWDNFDGLFDLAHIDKNNVARRNTAEPCVLRSFAQLGTRVVDSDAGLP